MHIHSEQLGQAIRELRELRGITQRELAQKLDVTVNFVSLLENGKRGVSVPNLNAVGKILGVPTAFITFLGTRCSSKKEHLVQLVEQIQKLIRAAIAAAPPAQPARSGHFRASKESRRRARVLAR